MQEILDVLKINPKVLVVQIMAFLVLFIVLWKFLFTKVGSFMKDRTKGIEASFKKIEEDQAEAHRLLEEYKDKLANIEKEGYEKIQQAVREGNVVKEGILKDAQESARKERDAALEDIKLEKEKAIHEMRHEMIQLSLKAAEKLVDATMNEQMHGKMVDEFLRDLDKTV